MITVAVRVRPGASRVAVTLLDDGSLEVWVRPRAIDGKANDGVIEVLAERLGLRTHEVRITSGTRSRRKLVALELPSHAELRRRVAGGG